MSERLRRLWARCRHFRTDDDLEDELRSHIEMQAEENVAPGVSVSEAQRRARLRLGSDLAIVERVRDQEFATFIESWYRDFLLGLRMLRKNPLFCLTAILTLALGIGANTAIFALLYGLLLRSLPAKSPDELAQIRMVSTASKFNDADSSIPYRMIEQFRHEQQSFSDISIWSRAFVPLEDSEGTMRFYHAGTVSGNAFPLFGMKPYLGRLIAPADDVRGGPSEGWPVVLSYGFWNENFGGDPAVLGKQIKTSGIPATIVGVAPPEFHGVWPGDDIKLYFPFQFRATLQMAMTGEDSINDPAGFVFCSAIGRLKSGVSIQHAQVEAKFYEKQLFRQFIPAKYQHRPFYEQASLRVESARSGLPTYFGHIYSQPLKTMQGLVLIVLLLCCVNVGGLMMSKVYSRQREFAVRTAIGAARWRLIRQYMTESLVIALAGAALAGLATWYGSPTLLHFFRDPMMGEPIAIRPDRMVFWATGACAIGTTLLFGLLPAWRAGRTDPGVLLTSRTTAGNRKQIAGKTFVPIQVALSLVLVAVAAMLSRGLLQVRNERTGFELDHVTIQTAPFHLGHLPQKDNARLDVYQRMIDRLNQMPGIRSAAVTRHTPMTGFDSRAQFEAVTSNPNPPKDPHMAYNEVGPGYFQTMNTHIEEGREFEKNERSRDVCVLNRAAAAYLFPHEAGLGRYVRSDDPQEFPQPVSCRVIGIAEDAKFASLREGPPRTIYFPVTAETLAKAGNLVFLINSTTKADAITGYRKAHDEMIPTVPLNVFVTLKDQMDAALGSQELITQLSNLFALLALFLSALGLYGLLSSSVAQRTGEIGVRIALGARRIQVLRMILTEALGLLVAGMLVGGVGLLVAIRFLKGMLFGTLSVDPLILAGTLVLLTVVVVVAAAIPALRAASVNPVEALRAE
jgi:predicted permease